MKNNIFDDQEFYSSYMKLRMNPVGHNELIEKPLMYSLLPNLEGKKIIDLGCGHGDFCRYASANKAKYVIGLDISERMLNYAQTFDNPGNIKYLKQDMVKYVNSQDNFDLVFSSLSIHYVEDYIKLFRNIFKHLKNGGSFIFSVEHPIYTAQVDGWSYDKNNVRKHWKLDSYSQEGKREGHWLDKTFYKYHRKLESYLMCLIRAGFTIEEVLEPQPDINILEINPSLAYETMRPPFLVVSARKGLIGRTGRGRGTGTG